MSAFAVDAALEGFRFTRERPRDIALWTALSFAGGLAGNAILIASGAEAGLAEIARMSPTDPAAMKLVFSALPSILPGLAVHSALSLVMFAVLACSAFRALLDRGEPARLKLGVGELRMMLLMMALALVNLGVLLVVSGFAGALSLATGGAASESGQALLAVGQLAGIALQGLVMVRLAIASPMSVAEGRWSLADSWKRTRGRFWSLLATLVIAALLYLLVVFLVSQLFGRLARIAAMAVGGAAPGSGLAQLAHPGVLITQAGLSLALALGVPILAGPLAYAYRAFSPTTARAPAPVSAAR